MFLYKNLVSIYLHFLREVYGRCVLPRLLLVHLRHEFHHAYRYHFPLRILQIEHLYHKSRQFALRCQ